MVDSLQIASKGLPQGTRLEIVNEALNKFEGFLNAN
jgi:hypothetical protein